MLRLALHTVFIPRESILFLREWLIHHQRMGVAVFHLYDNTGSRQLGYFQHGHSIELDGKNKYGVPVRQHTQALSDDAVVDELARLQRELPLVLTPWKPLAADGTVAYEQGAAYSHFMREQGGSFDWVLGTDTDEYLVQPGGEPCSSVLPLLENIPADVNRVAIHQQRFLNRYDGTFEPTTARRSVASIEQRLAVCHASPKCFVRPKAYLPAGHWSPHAVACSGRSSAIDPAKLRFNHYNVPPPEDPWSAGKAWSSDRTLADACRCAEA